MIAEQLIKKYNLAPNSYYSESPYTKAYKETERAKQEYLESSYRNNELNEKWLSKIPSGWYGFDFGYPTPTVWYDVINEFLENVEMVCPNFQILQQKVKFGGYRCYLDNINEEISQEIHKLEAVLYDKNLIY